MPFLLDRSTILCLRPGRIIESQRTNRSAQEAVASFEPVTEELYAYDEEDIPPVVRCICGEQIDDEYESRLMVQCDSCGCWQHAPCVGLLGMPGDYYCELCTFGLKVSTKEINPLRLGPKDAGAKASKTETVGGGQLLQMTSKNTSLCSPLQRNTVDFVRHKIGRAHV